MANLNLAREQAERDFVEALAALQRARDAWEGALAVLHRVEELRAAQARLVVGDVLGRLSREHPKAVAPRPCRKPEDCPCGKLLCTGQDYCPCCGTGPKT